jgi:hypothetical protein
VDTGQERLRLFADDLQANLPWFAPDGSWMIARDGGRALRILDAADGRELAAFPADESPGKPAAEWEVPIAPDEREVLLLRPLKQELHIWDVRTKRVRLVVPNVAAVSALSRDGQLLAVVLVPPAGAEVSSDKQTLAVLDATTGRELARQSVRFSHSSRPDFSPNRDRLVQVVAYPGWVDAENAVQIWDFTAGSRPVTIAKYAMCGDAEFTSDGRGIAVRTHDGVRLLDLSQTPPRKHIVSFDSVTVGSPSDILTSWCYSRSPRKFLWPGPSSDALEMWETCDPHERTVFQLGDREGSYPQCVFSTDGGELAVLTGPHESAVAVWLREHLGYPKDVLSWYQAHVFDARTGTERLKFSLELGKLLGFSSDGQTLWTIGYRPNPAHQAVVSGTAKIDGWATASTWPPIWLLLVTGVCPLLIQADWRRSPRPHALPAAAAVGYPAEQGGPTP